MKFDLHYDSIESWNQLIYRLESLTATIKREYGNSAEVMLPQHGILTSILSDEPYGHFDIEWPDSVAE